MKMINIATIIFSLSTTLSVAAQAEDKPKPKSTYEEVKKDVKEVAQDTKKEVKHAWNKVKEKTCELRKDDGTCLKEKIEHRIESVKENIKDKVN